MNLKEKILGDFKNAFKEKKETEVSVFKILQAEIRNTEIAKRTKLAKAGDSNAEAASVLTDEEIMQVVSREIKKRRDSAEMYKKGNRPELAEKEEKEIDVLLLYLPEQLSESEIKNLAQKAIEQSGAKTVQEISKVMGILSPQTKGKADGALVNKIVRELLN